MTTSIKTRSIRSLSNIFKILSSPTRLKILTLLSRTEDELCVNEIADHIGMTQSATSHQLIKLEDKGIVASERTGQTVCYHFADSEMANTIKHFISRV